MSSILSIHFRSGFIVTDRFSSAVDGRKPPPTTNHLDNTRSQPVFSIIIILTPKTPEFGQ